MRNFNYFWYEYEIVIKSRILSWNPILSLPEHKGWILEVLGNMWIEFAWRKWNLIVQIHNENVHPTWYYCWLHLYKYRAKFVCRLHFCRIFVVVVSSAIANRIHIILLFIKCNFAEKHSRSCWFFPL